MGLLVIRYHLVPRKACSWDSDVRTQHSVGLSVVCAASHSTNCDAALLFAAKKWLIEAGVSHEYCIILILSRKQWSPHALEHTQIYTIKHWILCW